MTTTRNGTRIRDLQLCAADPADIEGAKSALGSVAALTGVHQRVTVRSYGTHRRACIRTLLVRSDPDGHIEITAVGGTYRYLIVGGGTVELHISSPAGTLVDILDASRVMIDVTDVSIDVAVRPGCTTTINTTSETRGRIEVAPNATCTVHGAGPQLQILSSSRKVVQIPPKLAEELLTRIPTYPFRYSAPAAATDRSEK